MNFLLARLRQKIFLTGLPRSGTTWAGHALKAATGSVLVEEPFNWKFHPRHKGFDSKYLPAGSQDRTLIDALERALFSMKRPRRTARLLLGGRVIVRDVFVSLALEQICEHFRPQPLIVVRHPCGVASSWRKLDFRVDYRLETLLNQEKLLEDFLGPYKAHLERPAGFFFQLGAYWGAVHHVLLQQAERNPGWQFVTHEALCLEGAAGFRAILDRFGVDISPGLSSYLAHTNRELEADESAFSVFRRSAQEPDKWRALLAPEEIDAVLAGAEPFAVLQRFYPI